MNLNNLDYLPDGSVCLSLDTKLYSRDAILRTAYLFTNKCYINMASYGNEEAQIDFMAKKSGGDMKLLVKEFLNELIDQQLRCRIDCETKDIKKMIIAEAFAPLENVPKPDNE